MGLAIFILATVGSGVLVEERSREVLGEEVSRHVTGAHPVDFNEALFLEFMEEMEANAHMVHAATCGPTVGIVNGSFVVNEELHGFLDLQSHGFQDSHAKQHVLGTAGSTSQLSFSDRQSGVSLDVGFFRDWSIFKEHSMSSNTVANVLVRIVACICSSPDLEFLVRVSIPASLGGQSESSLWGVHSISHGSVQGIDMFFSSIGVESGQISNSIVHFRATPAFEMHELANPRAIVGASGSFHRRFSSRLQWLERHTWGVWHLTAISGKFISEALQKDRLGELECASKLVMVNLAANIFYQLSPIITINGVHDLLFELEEFIFWSCDEAVIHPGEPNQ